MPRRRVIEGGLIALGILLAAMALSGRISALPRHGACRAPNLPDLSLLTSLLSIVVGVAFFAGIAYACVAIPSQTQLQEDLPDDVRGRVFGILNMLVSVASFLPILIVGPIADWIGTTAVLVTVAAFIGISGVASIYLRGPLQPMERVSRASVGTRGDPFVEALGAEVTGPEDGLDEDGDDRCSGPAPVADAPRRRGPARALGDPSREQDPDLDPEHARDPPPDRPDPTTHAAHRRRLHGGHDHDAARPASPAATSPSSVARTSSPPSRARARSPISSRSTSALTPASHFQFDGLFAIRRRDRGRPRPRRRRWGRRRPGHRRDRGDGVLPSTSSTSGRSRSS